MAKDRRRTKRDTLDRRQHRRHEVDIHPCWIAIDGKRYAKECRLTNISKAGATLTVPEHTVVPETFVLYLVESGAIARKCRVVWRDRNAAGLKFMAWMVETQPWMEMPSEKARVASS